MIWSFRHKGLRRLFEEGDARGVDGRLALRLANVLAALSEAVSLDELATVPGWRLHALKGELKGLWSISVSGNWRVVFRFEERNALDVDLVDYH